MFLKNNIHLINTFWNGGGSRPGESYAGVPGPTPIHHDKKTFPRPLSSGTETATEIYEIQV